MKRGSFNTILKRRDRAYSGRPKNHRDPRKASKSKSKIKIILIAFFDQNGLAYNELVPEGKTVNQYFYQQVLIRLHDRVRRSRRALWSDKSWLFDHDNAPAHNAVSVRRLLIKTQITALYHPPYFPD